MEAPSDSPGAPRKPTLNKLFLNGNILKSIRESNSFSLHKQIYSFKVGSSKLMGSDILPR